MSKALAALPGPHQEKFETRSLWAMRQIRARSSTHDFAAELARLTPSSVVIDLGANVGKVTQQLAQYAGTVHAFEPEPWAHSQLLEATKGLSNVVVHQAAAGIKDGVIEFKRDPDFELRPEIHSQGTSIYNSMLWDDSQEAEVFQADIIDLRRFIRDLGCRVELIKIDIEGSEVNLLEGLVGTSEWDMIDAVFVETHECQILELRDRTARLRQRLSGVKSPRVYLDWH
ncbi:MAG: FkbM family methyltransferase [Pseudomonadota bacterium]